MKQVPAKVVTGDLGENLAAGALMRIGWAPPVKIPQDIGDDLMTFARVRPQMDQPTYAWDLEAPVFIQVKASPTAYCEPDERLAGRDGWWFADSDSEHFDHWLSFGLPYLLVLVDTKNEIAYWAQVKAADVVSTGKGRKLFVPADQRIDDASLDALNEIAVEPRSSALEGKVWDGGYHDIAPNGRLRNALVIPRLLAPHPNRSNSRIDFEQAVALILRNRFREVSQLANSSLCPPPSQWSSHRRWGWRFVAGLKTALDDGLTKRLEELASIAPSAYERDACQVTIACIAYSRGRPTEALAALKTRKTTTPADLGWLLGQQAHMLLELEDHDGAARKAQEALFALKAIQGDLSVSSIRGGCAAVLYAASAFGGGDLAETISAQDNAGSWWRAQSIAGALGDDLSDRFAAWFEGGMPRVDDSRSIGELSSAAWSAAFAANWANWRHLLVQRAQVVLTLEHGSAEAIEALDRLIFVGAKPEAKAAARRIWRTGSVSSLHGLVSAIATAPWLRRSEGSCMAVLAEAGDLLPPNLADHATRRILNLLVEDGPTREFAGGWTDRWSEIDDAISRCLFAATPAAHAICAQFVIENFAGAEHHATALVQIAQHLDYNYLELELLNDLQQTAEDLIDSHGIDLLEVLGRHHEPAQASLRKHARTGSSAASRALLVAGSTARQDWVSLGRSSRVRVESILEEAAGDTRTHYALDFVLDLAQAAFHTGNSRLWKFLNNALETGLLSSRQSAPTIWFLANNFDDLPAYVRRRLTKLAPKLTAQESVFESQEDFLAAVEGLKIASRLLAEDEILGTLHQVRQTSSLAFIRLLRIWKTPIAVDFLVCMCSDPDPMSRAHAAYETLGMIETFPEQVIRAIPAMEALLCTDGGCFAALAIADALGGTSVTEFQHLRGLVGSHPSALVRNRLSRG